MALWPNASGRRSSATTEAAVTIDRKHGKAAHPKEPAKPHAGSPRATSASIPCPKCGRRITADAELLSYQAMYDSRSLRMYYRLVHHRQTKELACCPEISPQGNDESPAPQKQPSSSFEISQHEWCTAGFPLREGWQQPNSTSNVAGLHSIDWHNDDDDIEDDTNEDIFALDL